MSVYVKLKKKDTQFLLEKIIDVIDQRQTSIILEIEKTYMICRQVYQSLYVGIAGTFIQYIHSLETDEIEQLDHDTKAN